ncbi:hypothetical protein GF336_02175 [Candidatus Woesearchaeota archaeon]|nr:hypothetical protein [Candidatus Woesearchaeota archaeon]
MEGKHINYNLIEKISAINDRVSSEAGIKANSYLNRATEILKDALYEGIVALKEHQERIYVATPAENGNIPSITATGKSLAEAWENSLLALYKHGCEIRTQYDRKSPGGNFIDPPSKDSTFTFIVEDPSSEPLIHRSFPGGPSDLEEYRQEVVEGVKNHWVRDLYEPSEDEKWEYTYNERLFEYAVPLNELDIFLKKMPGHHRENIDTKRIKSKKKPLEFLLEQDYVRVEKRPVKKWAKKAEYVEDKNSKKGVRKGGTWYAQKAGTQDFIVIDQIAYVVDKLSEQPYSRQAQAITWKPQEDTICYDPACLQSIWFRILPDEQGIGRLNMNVRFRSRDAYKAAFMNAFAFINLQEVVAKKISEKVHSPITLGRYLDISDSYHIYGKDLADFRKSFISPVCLRDFEDRTWTRGFANEFFEEAKSEIAEKIKKQDENIKDQLQRKKQAQARLRRKYNGK